MYRFAKSSELKSTGFYRIHNKNYAGAVVNLFEMVAARRPEDVVKDERHQSGNHVGDWGFGWERLRSLTNTCCLLMEKYHIIVWFVASQLEILDDG